MEQVDTYCNEGSLLLFVKNCTMVKRWQDFLIKTDMLKGIFL